VCADAEELLAGLVQPIGKLLHEHRVGELRVEVHAPTIVAALLSEDIVQRQRAPLLHRARDDDDARAGSLAEQRKQPPRQREVTEMVRPERHLEAVFGARLRDSHEPRVVDEPIDDREAFGNLLRAGLDGREIGQIERHERDAARVTAGFGEHELGRALGLAGCSAGQDHVRALSREHLRRLEPEAAIRSRNHETLASLVRYVARDPAVHEEDVARASAAVQRRRRDQPRSVTASARARPPDEPVDRAPTAQPPLSSGAVLARGASSASAEPPLGAACAIHDEERVALAEIEPRRAFDVRSDVARPDLRLGLAVEPPLEHRMAGTP
jgi:hypothetical protein